MPLVESTDLRFVARAAVPSAGAATIAGICGATAFGGSKSSGKTFSHTAAFRMSPEASSPAPDQT